jgi:ribokinase
VVGSCNVDLVWQGPRLPARGETVSDGVFSRTVGGKGANQAAAAACLGAVVEFVGCVGDDDDGALARTDLEARGIDCRWLRTQERVATGTALINVDAGGANMITVAPGANRFLSAELIEAAIASTDAEVLITGLEIGVSRAAVALRAGQARALDTVCNASPVDATVNAHLAGCSTVVVNELEAVAYGGPAAILAMGVGEAVVTLGAAGAERHRADGTERVAGYAVDVIDTTGAGDAFCAALALSGDLRFACAAGALACRAVGARTAQPSVNQVEELIKEPPRSRRGRGQ